MPTTNQLLSRDALSEWMGRWRSHMLKDMPIETMRHEIPRTLRTYACPPVLTPYASLHASVASLVFGEPELHESALHVRLHDAVLHLIELRTDDAGSQYTWYSPERMGGSMAVTPAKAHCLLQHAKAQDPTAAIALRGPG